MDSIIKTSYLSEALAHMKPGTFCVMDYFFHQYAPGATGSNQSFNYFLPEGGFKKRPAQQFKNNELAKAFHEKGDIDYGYGSVGTKTYNKKIVSYETLLYVKEHTSYSYQDQAAFYAS